MTNPSRKASGAPVPPRTFIYIGVGLVTFVLGVAVGWWGKDVPQPNKVLRESGYTYIKPVLLCNINQPAQQTEDTDLSASIAHYIKSAQEKDVGVYYLNPTTGQWAGVNEDESFSPASMLKVPIMTAILRTAEKAPGLLNKSIYYDGSFDDNALETIKPQNPIVTGHAYTVDQLLEKMIKYSDNNATHLLYALLPQAEFSSIFTDLGLAAPTVNGPVDFMSPKTFTMFLRVLYGSTYLTRNDSEKALAYMAYPDFPQGLQAGLPEGTVVAQKFGEREASGQPSELHDCGVVYYGDSNAYMLCVMTHGKDTSVLSKEIADISKLVWEHVAQ